MDKTKEKVTEIPPQSVKPPANKGRGCWIAFGIGCGLLIILSVIATVGFFALVAKSADFSGTVSENVIQEGSEGKLAVINLAGIIGSDTSGGMFGSSTVNPDVVSGHLKRAFEDEDVKAVLLRVDSPGGEVVASDIIYNKVAEVAQKKPVIAWVSSMGASGAYYVASGANKIVMHPQSLTGSIGVLMEFSSLRELYKKIGIENKVLTSGRYKNPESELFDKKNPDNETIRIFQTLIDESYEEFVKAVATGRNMTVDEVKKLADGRIYSGSQAVKNGLADQTGYLQDAIKLAEKECGESNLTVIEYKISSFWSSLHEMEGRIFGRIDRLDPKPATGVFLYYLMDI